MIDMEMIEEKEGIDMAKEVIGIKEIIVKIDILKENRGNSVNLDPAIKTNFKLKT